MSPASTPNSLLRWKCCRPYLCRFWNEYTRLLPCLLQILKKILVVKLTYLYHNLMISRKTRSFPRLEWNNNMFSCRLPRSTVPNINKAYTVASFMKTYKQSCQPPHLNSTISAILNATPTMLISTCTCCCIAILHWDCWLIAVLWFFLVLDGYLGCVLPVLVLPTLTFAPSDATTTMMPSLQLFTPITHLDVHLTPGHHL